MKTKIIFLLIFSAALMISCSSCKTNESENGNKQINNESSDAKRHQTYEGIITIVGNEPFTKLGIILDETNIYLLECDEETKNELKKNQGKLYKVIANEKIETETGIKLVVYKTEKIK